METSPASPAPAEVYVHICAAIVVVAEKFIAYKYNHFIGSGYSDA
jgi:hypothetical protein